MSRVFDPLVFDPRIFQVGEAVAANNCTMDTTQPPQWSEVDANAVQAPASPWGGGSSDVARVVRRALAARVRPLAARIVPVNACSLATQQAAQVGAAQATQTQGMSLTTAQAAQQAQAECCIDPYYLAALYDLDEDLPLIMFGLVNL